MNPIGIVIILISLIFTGSVVKDYVTSPSTPPSSSQSR